MGTGSSKKKKNKESVKLLQPKALTKRQKRVILKQQSRSLCQICTKDGKSTGFLSKIPTPVLITNNHILNESEIKPGKEISIDFIDENEKVIHKTIEIDDDRMVYTIGKFEDEEIDTTIIEIRPEEDGLAEQEFIEVDKDLMNEGVEKVYDKKDVYVIYYKNGEEGETTGVVTKVEKKNKNFTLVYSCNTKHDFSGSPIISYEHKVIGLNKKNISSGQFNRATFLQFPIKEFITKLEEKKVFLENKKKKQ